MRGRKLTRSIPKVGRGAEIERDLVVSPLQTLQMRKRHYVLDTLAQRSGSTADSEGACLAATQLGKPCWGGWSTYSRTFRFVVTMLWQYQRGIDGCSTAFLACSVIVRLWRDAAFSSEVHLGQATSQRVARARARRSGQVRKRTSTAGYRLAILSDPKRSRTIRWIPARQSDKSARLALSFR